MNLDELIQAFEWVSGSGAFEHAAYVDRASGKIYWSSESGAPDEELPEDIEDGTRYVAVPDKRDLDLGRELALDFAQAQLPGSYDLVRGYFAKRGAYARFKELLEREGRLEAWYQYETGAILRRLREWAQDNELEIGP